MGASFNVEESVKRSKKKMKPWRMVLEKIDIREASFRNEPGDMQMFEFVWIEPPNF